MKPTALLLVFAALMLLGVLGLLLGIGAVWFVEGLT